MVGKSNGSTLDDWARAPPPPGSGWERFCKALYNPEDKSFLGRTPKRWAIVLVFYAIFYAVLAAMFSACMAGLFYTLDNSRPTFTLKASLIGDNPGVSFRPLPENVNDFVLRFSANNITETHPIIEQLNALFQDHKEDPAFATRSVCSSADNYGYPATPCYFIKINRIFDWIPELYDASNLPAEAPEDLKELVSKLPPAEQSQIWISCWDEDTNSTSLEYPWGQGIPASAFPFKGTSDPSPLVAVRIIAEPRTIVTVRCRAWAKNILYNKSIKEPRGYARIQFENQDLRSKETSQNM